MPCVLVAALMISAAGAVFRGKTTQSALGACALSCFKCSLCVVCVKTNLGMVFSSSGKACYLILLVHGTLSFMLGFGVGK